MQRNKKYDIAGLLLAAIAALTACSSPATRFYTLASSTLPVAAPAVVQARYFQLHKVNMPEALSRPQIVLRSNASELDVREQDRWVSSFNAELRDALAQRIAANTGATDVTRGGLPPDANAYRIAVDLQQFAAIQGKEVRAVFGWTVTLPDAKHSRTCKLAVTEPVNGMAVSDVVSSVQKITDKVSASIAGGMVNTAQKEGCAG